MNGDEQIEEEEEEEEEEEGDGGGDIRKLYARFHKKSDAMTEDQLTRYLQYSAEVLTVLKATLGKYYTKRKRELTVLEDRYNLLHIELQELKKFTSKFVKKTQI
jgi:hypothetical protein